MPDPSRGRGQDFHQLVQEGKKDRVEQRLRSAFNAIPQGCNFKPDLQGVDQVTIIRPIAKDAQSLNVVLFFQDGKKHITLSLRNEGKVAGKIPKELAHLSHEEIAAEIVRNLEQIQPEFWSEIVTPVLPEGHGAPLVPRQAREDIPARDRMLVDPKRIEHLRQKGARFGGLEKIGLSGYHVFIFDGFMVLENERIDNAAYVVKILKGVVIPAANAPKEERDAFFALPKIVTLLSQSKQELIADKENTIRIVHKGDWRKKVDDTIEQQSAAA